MVTATTQQTISRADIVEWVDKLIEQGKTYHEAQVEVFEEILRDGLAEELLRLLGAAATVGDIWRTDDRRNRPTLILKDWTARPVERAGAEQRTTIMEAGHVLLDSPREYAPSVVIADPTAEEGQLVGDALKNRATPPVRPQPTYGAARIPLSALTRDTSMLTGKYDVPGIGLVALGEMTKSHCRLVADQFLREGRSKLTYAKWFRNIEASLADEKEQVKVRWDEQRILNLFELSEPKL